MLFGLGIIFISNVLSDHLDNSIKLLHFVGRKTEVQEHEGACIDQLVRG